MDRSNTVIVIPAYNEESTIQAVIEDISIYGDVIIVNDSSIDNTAVIAKNGGAIVITHETNKGYESALSTGVSYATDNNYDYIITADADGELLPSGVPSVLSLLKNKAAIVVGIRSNKNRFIEAVFGFLTFLLLKAHIVDPLCGMKGYSKKLCQSYGLFDTRKMIGTELLAYAIRDKLVVKQVSIDVCKREGDSRYGNSLKSSIKICRTICLFFMIVYNKKKLV